MPAIRISASREYDVIVERGILGDLGKFARRAVSGSAKIAAVVSDDRVFELYGKRACDALQEAGFRVVSFVFPHGEQSKTLAVYGEIVHFLSENHLTRSDFLVALGGGIPGDITGFAAATYQRGIPFIQIPTTLLAAVDSSVGGKTAVNLETGKNQVGCFYQPSLVLCDPEVLKTLPEEEYRCGCAEVIKYGILGNAEFFRELRERPIKNQLERVITTCVSMKRDIVAEDEFDRGKRQLLNLGHTIGHAIEACSGFKILHGEAVAAGMALIARAAFQKGICGAETVEAILSVLKEYGLPTGTDFSAEELLRAVMSDKKMNGDRITLVLPEKIGKCRLEELPAEQLESFIHAGGIQ